MSNAPLLFLDSGIGGLPYLDWVKSACPGQPVVYLADTAHFPYGEMPPERLCEAVCSVALKATAHFQPRLLVLACNTASVAALDAVRASVDCPVVGTVPAVKPAASLGQGETIGVLATRGTVNSSYLDNLIRTFAPHNHVVRVAAGDIVRYVEERYTGAEDRQLVEVLRPSIDELLEHNVNSVVLGCTHFLHIAALLGRLLGPDIHLIDSREGVGRRVLDLAGCTVMSAPAGQGAFAVSQAGLRDNRYRFFAALHNLEWMGAVE